MKRNQSRCEELSKMTTKDDDQGGGSGDRWSRKRDKETDLRWTMVTRQGSRERRVERVRRQACHSLGPSLWSGPRCSGFWSCLDS